jgi:iron complex transport system ATP-binding protein
MMMEPVLSLKGVRKWLGEKLVLDGVDWTVNPGEHWALLGLNGSGKTTLLRIATGHLWPSEGEVSILGHPLGTVDLRRLRRSIGWVTSALTVRMPGGLRALDVVVSGKFDSIGLYDTATGADLKKAGELSCLMGCPDIVEREFGVLSQGEQQRILIARALMPAPKLLVLDEPSVGLDMKAREAFLEAVGRLAGTVPSVVYVTHHIEEIMPQFTHAMLLKDGRVRASGPKGGVIRSADISEAFGLEVRVESEGGRYSASF